MLLRPGSATAINKKRKEINGKSETAELWTV